MKLSRPGRLGGGDVLASGFAVAALALLVGFISLPLLSLVIWTVNEEAWRAMASPVTVDALLLSIRTTAVTMAIILLIGTPAAYVLARADFPGKRLVDTLVDIPAVLPPSAAGIALLLAFGRMGLLGEHLQILGIQLSFTTAAVVMAELFVATHFYVRQAAVGFSRVDRGVEEAAMVDGASRLRTFGEVVLPVAAPGLAATAILTFLYSWNEFLFALSFTLGPERHTVPVAIALFRGRYQVPWGQILAASVVATAPVALVVLGFQRRIVQGLTAGAVKG